MSARARVLIAEPHEVCRRAIGDLIAGTRNGLTVVAEAAGRREAVALAAHHAPEVILLGLGGPEERDVIAELRASAPKARIVVLSLRDDGEAVFEAMRSGAHGFLPKSVDPSEIVDALRRVAGGDSAVHPSVTMEGLRWGARSGGATEGGEVLARLTARERETLELLAQGLGSKAIAARLFLSRRTVEFHLANVYRKLGVHGRIEAAAEFRKLMRS